MYDEYYILKLPVSGRIFYLHHVHFVTRETKCIYNNCSLLYKGNGSRDVTVFERVTNVS